MKKNTLGHCLILCELCGEAVPCDLNSQKETICSRCGCANNKKTRSDTALTFCFSLAAIILYIPANILPFMSFEMYGNKVESNIWEGIVSLSKDGTWPLAVIVFIASLVVPLLKILILFYLSLFGKNGKNQKFKTKIYKFVEIIGPWSMLDIFLLAVLIAIIKFDSMANVEAGSGSIMFLLVVICTIIASSSFNKKVIWEKHD